MCVLILCPENSVHLFISAHSFLSILQDFLHLSSCHLQTEIFLPLPFRSGCLSFLSTAGSPWLDPPVRCWREVTRSWWEVARAGVRSSGGERWRAGRWPLVPEFRPVAPSEIHVLSAFLHKCHWSFVSPGAWGETANTLLAFPSIAGPGLSWWAPADLNFYVPCTRARSDSACTNAVVATHNWVFPSLCKPAPPPQPLASVGSLQPSSEALAREVLSVRLSPATLLSFLCKPLCAAHTS